MPRGGWNDQLGKLSEAEREQLRSLYIDQGLSTRAIAETMSLSGVTVSRWLRRLGVNMRPVGGAKGRRRRKPEAERRRPPGIAYADLDHTIEPFDYTGRPY